MKKLLSILCLLISGVGFAQAQDPQVSHELKSPITESKTYIARDFIKLMDGFTFKPTSGEVFHAKIDQALLFPPTDATYMKPDGTITSDPTAGGVVGTIPGQFAVSPSGSATYNIPIECPAGINDLTPGIGISYNSQSGSGLLGYGMNLTGLSVITRTPDNPYFDDNYHPVSMDANDKFALNGQRLLVTSGVYGANDSRYFTESDVSTRVTSLGNTGSAPASFLVESKNGMVMEFGNTTDSKIMLPGRTGIFMWRINRIADQNGNAITFTYGQSNGESWIESINYIGNTYLIDFNYTSRQDESFAFVDGIQVPNTKLLENIEIKHGSTLLKRYSFDYITDLYTHLTDIKLENGEGEIINPTVFNWNHLYRGSEGRSLSCISSVPADFNKDGKIDLYALVEEDNKYYERLYLNNGSTFTKANWENEITEVGQIYDEVFDFDGDGMADILYLYNDKSIMSFLHVNGSTGTSFKSITAKIIGTNFKATTGDFDGDGLSEVFIMQNNGSCSLLDYDRSNNTSTLIALNENGIIDSGTYHDKFRFQQGDYNGDGKVDMGFYEDNAFKTFQINGTSLSSIFTKSSSSIGLNPESGDINGDGITDLISASTFSIKSYFWTANGVHEVTEDLPIPEELHQYFLDNGVDLSQTNYLVDEEIIIDGFKGGDINKDGRLDAMLYYRKVYGIYNIGPGSLPQNIIDIFQQFTNNGGEIGLEGIRYQTNVQFVYGLGKGDGHFIFFGKRDTGDSEVTVDEYERTFLVDFNSDGFPALYKQERNVLKYDQTNFSYVKDVVKYITDGQGNKITISHAPICEGGDLYTSGTDSSFPVVDLIGPLHVVDVVTRTNGVCADQTEQYSYKSAKVHVLGKGFLGFMESTVNNLQQQTKLTRTNEVNTTYYSVYPKYEEQFVNNISSAKTTYTFAFDNLSNKRFKSRLTSQKEENILEGITKLVSYNEYDDFLNPEQITTEFIGSNIKEVKTVNYINKGSWCPNKPETVTITKENGVDTDQIRVNKYSYDTKGNLAQEIKDLGDVNEVVTDYLEVDALGHPKTVKVTANGKSRSTTFIYSNDGRFVSEKTDNTTGLKTSYQYYETTGHVKSETDVALNLTTTYDYDGFRRLTKTTHPDGTYTVNSLQWANNDGPDNALYYSYTETSGQSPEWVWYDKNGRELRKDYYGFDTNSKIAVKTAYNSKGQVHIVSKPFYLGDDPVDEITYTYDVYGRVFTKDTPMGQTTYDYSTVRQTTVTTPSGSTTELINHAGQLIKSTVNGRSVDYTYWPSGLTKTSTPEEGSAVETFFDTQGNRAKLIDPDAGTVESEYNGFGELVWQDHKKTKFDGTEETIRSSYIYDDAGRVLTSNVNGVTTTTKYDPNTGFIEYTKNDDGHEVYYTYDEGSNLKLGRITTYTEKVEGKTFTSHSEYDYLGRETKHTYPSGYFTTNAYNKYSHLTEVKSKGSLSVWKAKSVNIKGQLTQVVKGDKTTTYGFDQETYLPESINCPGVLEHGYLFNSKGNLEYREDLLTNQKEVFNYKTTDNQLDDWTVYKNGTSVAFFDMDYDVHGNITTKSDIGYTMAYGEPTTIDGIIYDAGPHALTSIKGNPTLIGDDEQSISYTDFLKVETITEGDKLLELTYGIDHQRRKAVYKTNGNIDKTRYYLGDYEEDIVTNGNDRKVHYISGSDGLAAIYIETNGSGQLYYAYTDYLGSLTTLTDEAGTVVENHAFDPWGNRRDVNNWQTVLSTPANYLTDRGYTMHEHLDGFALINMNGRVYDPALGRFLSPDPQLQAPGNWLNYNRYAYCLNNPLIYTDPTGEFFWAALPLMVKIGIGIGAGLGAYSGYKIADAKGLSGLGMVGYILGGAAIGGVSGYFGTTIAASGGFMANTSSILFSSTFNSLGMTSLSGGDIAPSVSVGFASYNFGTGKLGHLWKKGNSFIENFGYFMGTMGVINDGWNAFYKDEMGETLYTHKATIVSHSSYGEDDLLSFGPGEYYWNAKEEWLQGLEVSKFQRVNMNKRYLFGIARGNNEHASEIDPLFAHSTYIPNINRKALELTTKIASILPYQGATINCANVASLGTWLSGIPNIGIHPHFLRWSMVAYTNGVRPDLFSYYAYD